MMSLILAVILGVIFTLVATQNPNLVDINFFGYNFNFPLYVIGALSFLAGLFVSLVFTIFNSTTKAIDVHR